MSERTLEPSSTTQVAANNDVATAPAQQSGAAMVRAMLASGQRNPGAIAGLMQSYPRAAAEIMMFLHQTVGNAFVQAVLSVVGSTVAANGAVAGAAGPMRVTARSGLHVRSSPDKNSNKNILGTLPHHEVVNATGRSGDWVAIDHASATAYVFGRYVEPVSAQEAQVPPAADHDEPDPTARKVEEDEAAPVTPPTPTVAPPTVETPTVAPPTVETPTVETPTPTVAPQAPTPTVAPQAPTPTVAPQAPTPTVAPQAPTPTVAPVGESTKVPGVDTAPAQVKGKATSKILKLARPLPKVHAFVPPGGVQGNVEVFLFLHGMFAHHDRSHDKGFRPGKDINDPNPNEAMNLAGAMAATTRNLVTLAPVAHFAGEWPLWNELAQNKGFKELIVQSLEQLGEELSIGPLGVGSISLAGHSAGGSGLGEAAKQFGDLIHDITYEDAGYADRPGKGSGWKQSHDKVAAWLLGGESDKLLRVLVHGEHNRSESTILHSHFNKESLEQTAHALKKEGVTVTREEGNHDKRTADKGMYLDHTLHVQGLQGARTVTVFKMPKANHMQVRNRATQHLISEGRDTQFEVDTDDATRETASNLPADHDAQDTHDAPAHDRKPAPDHDDDKPAPVAPTKQVEAKEPKPTPKPKSKSKKSKSKASAYDRDDKTDLDSFGNPTERIKRADKNHTGDNQRVFTNQFTTVSKAPLLTEGLKDAHRALAKGTILHTYEVNGKYAQVVTADIKLEDNLWIAFKYIGGDGSTKPEFGNESEDAKDRARADAIRERLPKTGRTPGSSRHKWQFASSFLPSAEGIALDASLMTKVNALMEWAIAEDMITDDIEIRSGVRPPITAHKFCIRFQLAHRDGAHVDFDAIRALPGGMYHGWKFCPVPGKSTDAEIKKQAHALYSEHGGSGAQAAAGFAPGAPGRSPLRNTGPGVSKHCPGHAVDIRIPWRSAKDPSETDLWAWEEVYHQFGLTRPLHRDRGFTGRDAEHWHIEETGKQLAGVDSEGGD